MVVQWNWNLGPSTVDPFYMEPHTCWWYLARTISLGSLDALLRAKQPHDLRHGGHVIVSLEERVAFAEQAEEDHTSRPHVNGSGLVGVLEEDFGGAKPRGPCARGHLVTPERE